MPNLKATPAFALMRPDDTLVEPVTIKLIRRFAEDLRMEQYGESVVSVVIVGREEWERQQLLNQWIAADDTGASSMTLWSVFAGVTLDDPDVPCDAGDAWCCLRFLALCKIDQSELSRVVEAYPIWRPYVDRWLEVEEKADSTEDLYLLMEEIEDEAERLKGAE